MIRRKDYIVPAIVQELYNMGGNYFRFGSREVCNPAPMDTDEDWAILLPNIPVLVDAVNMLDERGWERGGSEVPETEFLSFRKGDLNLVLTNSLRFYNKYQVATELCKDLNLLNKPDRINVFNKILNRI